MEHSIRNFHGIFAQKYFGENRDRLGSLWWKFPHDTGPTAGDLAMKCITPSSFHQYDGKIVRIGIYNVICALLPWKVDQFIKLTVENRQFCNEICRPRYFSKLDRKGVHDFLEAEKGLKEQDFVTRKYQMEETNEFAEDYHKWEK
jgi:hypothetical protein